MLTYEELADIIGNRSNSENNDETGLAENVLLQIILPIVLILAFLIFTKVHALEREANYYKGIVDKQLLETILELERQKLINALEKVKRERREFFGLDFLSKKGIEIVSGQLVDSDFKETCQKVYQNIGNKRSRKKEANFLYETVLTYAQLSSIPSKENSEFAREQIDEFIHSLVREVMYLQLKTIKKIWAYFLDKPDELDKIDRKLKELRWAYISASQKQKEVFAQKLYNRLHERLKADLKMEGYAFLEETWERIRL